MPPKKRARVSPEPTIKSSPTPAAEDLSRTDEIALLNDPWTDDEEIGLFKGLMKWKPTGIHKHFRLLALHAWMLENNYIHPRNAHTKPAGIWAKLNTLYDLSALDAREDARQLSHLTADAEQEAEDAEDAGEDVDAYSVADNKIENDDFDLAAMNADFSQLMWKARFADRTDDESEAELPELNMADEPPVRFTPSFSIEPSEPPASGKRSAKGKTARGKKSNAPTPAPRRSSRKPDSVADQEEEADDGDENDAEKSESEDEDDGQSEDEEEQSQASTPAPRRGRPPRQTKGKPVTKSTRGRGRGRGK